MRLARLFVVLLAMALMVPSFVLADASSEAVTDNHQRLEKLRVNDPQHYASLRHNFAVFRQLPSERQETLRKLERDLEDETPGHRQRLERVAERYADWLEHLSETDRQTIQSAPDRKTRLERIRALRDKQWLKRLPKAQADKIANAPEKERAELLKKFRAEELEEHLDWLAIQRNWDVLMRNPQALPSRLDMLSDETREIIEKSLRPLLSKEEEKILKDAEGKWPRFPRVLIELADQHPLSLQGPVGPTSLKDLNLPGPAQALLQNDKKLEPLRNRLKEAEGKWPEFGLAWRDVAALPWKDLPKGPVGKKPFPPLPPKYTPSRTEDLPQMVQQFIDKRLLPALDEGEAGLLKKAEGHWPLYPQTVLELARKHNLQVPNSLGRFDGLERYRWRWLTSHAGVPRRDPFGLLP
jgi:hypothetical protein